VVKNVVSENSCFPKPILLWIWEKWDKAFRQSTFILSVKSPQLKVVLINFILKADYAQAITALKLNISYYSLSFRKAAECERINILKSTEICPSATGEERRTRSEEEEQLCVKRGHSAARQQE